MKKFVAWDTEKRLSFAVPFSDMKPVIYLDPFLPRISELALSTSDRQTKVRDLATTWIKYIEPQKGEPGPKEDRNDCNWGILIICFKV